MVAVEEAIRVAAVAVHPVEGVPALDGDEVVLGAEVVSPVEVAGEEEGEVAAIRCVVPSQGIGTGQTQWHCAAQLGQHRKLAHAVCHVRYKPQM